MHPWAGFDTNFSKLSHSLYLHSLPYVLQLNSLYSSQAVFASSINSTAARTVCSNREDENKLDVGTRGHGFQTRDLEALFEVTAIMKRSSVKKQMFS